MAALGASSSRGSRLGRCARSRRRSHPRHRQRRSSLRRRRHRRSPRFRCRWRDDRTRGLRCAVAAGPDRGGAALPARPGAPELARQGAIAEEHVEAMLDSLRVGARREERAQARRLVPRMSGRPSRPSRHGAGGFVPRTTRARSGLDCVNSTASSGGRLMKKPAKTAKLRQPEPEQQPQQPLPAARTAPAAAPMPAALPARRPVEHDVLLAALPHAVLVVTEDNRVVYANSAAEVFLSTSAAMMKRTRSRQCGGVRLPLAGADRSSAPIRRDAERIRRRDDDAEVLEPQACRRLWRPSARASRPNPAHVAAAVDGADDRAAIDPSRGRAVGDRDGGDAGARDPEPPGGDLRCGAATGDGPRRRATGS